MSALHAGLGRVSKGPLVPKSAAPREVRIEEDEDDFDDGGQAADEIGKSFTFGFKLTQSEIDALERWRLSQDDDKELYPLQPKQRNASYGDIKHPVQSIQLGSSYEALCIASSSAGNMLAVGGRHGTVRLFHPQSLEPMDTIRTSELASVSMSGTATAAGNGRTSAIPGRRSPTEAVGSRFMGPETVVTSVCFRPDVRGSRMQNLMLVAQGDAVVHVHVGSRRAVHVLREEGNRINSVAMRQDGAMFATGGSDYVVRAYDEATCSLCRTLDHGNGVTTTGHTNHVFGLAWHPDDPQVLLSGGWDNHVLVWDLRVHRSVRSISGPHICGDALDVQSGGSGGGGGSGLLVLTGSWRNSNPLQLWDLGSGRLLTNLPWWQPEPDACLIYTARFGSGPAAGTVIAGGSGSKPMVRVYKLNGPANVELLYTVLLQRSVRALALVPSAATGSQGGCIGNNSQPVVSGPAVAVCCDEEVHTLSLNPGGNAP